MSALPNETDSSLSDARRYRWFCVGAAIIINLVTITSFELRPADFKTLALLTYAASPLLVVIRPLRRARAVIGVVLGIVHICVGLLLALVTLGLPVLSGVLVLVAAALPDHSTTT